MGGSILFTSSGTFKPSAYGLTTGKRINYIIIGGGGGSGAGWSDGGMPAFAYNTGGTYGGTTSIGSYVSANGAKPQDDASLAFVVNTSKIVYTYGGQGERGWTPGIIFTGYTGPGKATSTSSSSMEINGYKVDIANVGGITIAGWGQPENGSLAAATPNFNGGSSHHITNLTNISGNARGYGSSDGLGYGAGAGGVKQTESWGDCCSGGGGYAGTYKEGSFELTSTADIAITIGAGGTPHTSYSGTISDSNGHYSGATGFPGAAMLWWD